jgi:hypoxanthine-DNA glycosylase
MQIKSFENISTSNSKILILGTMPGQDSLKANEYYCHRNNLFWDIIFRICFADWKCDNVVSADYKTKTDLLVEHRIALWDVLKYCDRERSSLDKHIRNQVHNNFKDFFSQHPNIKAVFFNGKEAAKFFEDFRPNPAIFENRLFITLQSTSPSNKTNAFVILKQWMQIKNYL